jgi:small subunit ribosomal protein S6
MRWRKPSPTSSASSRARFTGEAIAEIERQAAINEDIIRWLTIKVDELEKGPSVMMRKQERRGGRGRDRDGEE